SPAKRRARVLARPEPVPKAIGDDDPKKPEKRLRTMSGRSSHRNLGLGGTLQSAVASAQMTEAETTEAEEEPRAEVRFVTITGVQGEERVRLTRQLEINGASVTENPLLADVCIRQGKLGRTLKVLCAMARGTPIVSMSWIAELSSTIKARMDAEDMCALANRHLLEDKETEAEWGVSLAGILAKAKKLQAKLLSRFCVLISDEVQRPDPVCLGVMVRAAGGALFNDFGKREEDLL
ncbi:Mediator of DNA damage checkpoint protein 1, partial [Linderina pennispora]